MKTKKKYSIFLKTQFYLIFFCLIVLLCLLVIETLYFKVYYRIYQINNAEKVVNSIKNKNLAESDANEYIENLAYKNSLCIAIYNDYGDILEYNSKMPGCNLKMQSVHSIIYNFLVSDQPSISQKITINKQNIGYLYGIKNGKTDVFVYISFEENYFFNNLIHHELIYIILIGVALSSALAFYLTNLITKPIRDITKIARNIGKENYANKFNETGIKEIDELNTTLDNVQRELGKIEKYQHDLLANVTHDLKTPLTMIKAYAEKIKDISYKDKVKLDADIKVIIEETNRLTMLVNDILDMSKASSNTALEIEKYDLVSEINNIMQRYAIIKETEHYNFILDMPKKAYVMADKKRINQVIYNLINNAINYTGNDQKVLIKVKKETQKYNVEIIDTGKGIKKEDLKNIWTKYYKNDKNHRRNVVSSGIGLSIVKDILEKHKYEYGVISKENEGSTFYFKIPSIKNPNNHVNHKKRNDI